MGNTTALMWQCQQYKAEQEQRLVTHETEWEETAAAITFRKADESEQKQLRRCKEPDTMWGKVADEICAIAQVNGV